MKLKWKATISLILAILVVSVYSYLGVEKEVKVDLDSCGFAFVKPEFIEIHTECKVMISVAAIPKVEIEDGLVKLTIPGGWRWRIIP